MNSMQFPWQDSLTVPVLQVEKGKPPKHVRDRVIHNAPLMFFWGSELSGYLYPVVIVEWRGKFTPADLRVPVKYRGVSYDCSWASGSFVKAKKTYGFPVGFRPLPGVFREEEQATKIGRALLPDAQFAIGGEFSVRTIENGKTWKGHPIEDGVGYIRESVLPANWADNSIVLTGCKQNYQIWQALGTTKPELYSKVLAELEEYIKGWWDAWTGLSNTERRVEGLRKELIELNEEMARHPYVAASTDESIAALFRQVAICPMLPQSMWLAVPARTWTAAAGTYVATRYPVASYSGTQIVTTDDSELEVSERERISKFAGALQVTLTAQDHSGDRSYKMILIVVPDSLWDDNVDIVTSDENLKLYRGNRDDSLGVAVLEGVLAVLNTYDKNRMLGIPADAFKIMAGDFDGDYAALMPLDPNKFPNTIQAFKSLPDVKGVKGKKTHNVIGDNGASDFLYNAMMANLGWATNARSATFAATNEQREALAKRLHEKGRIPKPEVWSMDIWLTTMVQNVVDSLKSNIPMSLVNGLLGEFNGILSDVLDAYPSYLRWKRSEWAWKKGRPRLHSELTPEMRKLYVCDDNFAQSDEMKSHISDETKGICADIFRFNSSLKVEGVGILEAAWVSVGMADEPLPLVHFKDWAPPVEESDIERAKAFVTAFQAWNDSRDAARDSGEYSDDSLEDIVESNDEWRNTCSRLADKLFDGDSHRACYSLWHLLHAKGSKISQGAAVFKGFPGIVRGIVAKADVGRSSGSVKTIMVGMAHNFKAVPETFSDVVEVNGREIHSVSGHPLLNGTLVAMVGDISVKNASEGFTSPRNGRYVLEAVPFSSSGKVWSATLAPVLEV